MPIWLGVCMLCPGSRHRLKDVEAILDAHNLDRDVQLTEAAVLKLEKRTILYNDL